MARRYKSIPEGAYISFEGRSYQDWYSVPSHATHVTIVWWGAKDPSLPATGDNRISVVLGNVPVGTRRGLVQARLDEVRQDYADQNPNYGSAPIANAEYEQGDDGFSDTGDEEFF